MSSGPYCHTEAFVEQDQIDWMGDGVLCQLVTVLLVDDTGEVEPAACALTAEQARELAFELLAARRARRQAHPPPRGGSTMSARNNAQNAALEALIEAHAFELKLPTVKARFRQMAAEATREQQTPIAYLAALLEAEHQERAERRERRRLLDARFPLLKRLEEFRFADNPKIPQATIAALADGSWINDRDSIVLVGDIGTGKTHLAIALAVCACQQGRRVQVHHTRRSRERTPRSRQPPRARPGRRPLLPNRGRGA